MLMKLALLSVLLWRGKMIRQLLHRCCHHASLSRDIISNFHVRLEDEVKVRVRGEERKNGEGRRGEGKGGEGGRAWTWK